MNFDRNTIFGFLVLATLLFGYFYFTNKEQAALNRQQIIRDSIADTNRALPKIAITKNEEDSIATVINIAAAGDFKNAGTGEEKLTIVENEVFKIAFTNLGGQPKWIELKNFKTKEGQLVKLAATSFDKLDYSINTTSNQTSRIANLYFTSSEVVNNSDGSKSLSFTLASDNIENAASIVHQFTVNPNEYMLGFDLQLNEANHLLTGEVLNLEWKYRAVNQEGDLKYERVNTQLGYSMNGEFDYHTLGRKTDVALESNVQWVGMRQRFFNTILVAKNNFTDGKIEWNTPNDSLTVAQLTANMQLKATGESVKIPLFIFYGPADYQILKSYNAEMSSLVNLGQGIYAFVSPVNKYIVLPVFDFCMKLVNSYGMAIFLLTVFIRVITSPLMYPGYKTSAQMKILRPDLAKLKEKFPDQQQFSIEQMKFMREAGVNQFAGCLPGLLQIPIFFALYSFFNAHVDLRGENFLWASDLSAYDSIFDFGTIPLISSIYGNHISLFTITACATSFLISIYSMSATPDQNNPVLKYMPYIFPVFLLFIFNSLPSALTWYYTVSNVITLGLQFVIQKFIIDHDKLLLKMEETRKKPKKKSKWQEQMEKIQEQQKKLKEPQSKR